MKAKITEISSQCTVGDLRRDIVKIFGYSKNGSKIDLQYEGPLFYDMMPKGEFDLEMEVKLTFKPKLPADVVMEFK
jgi:hypothetical protein